MNKSVIVVVDGSAAIYTPRKTQDPEHEHRGWRQSKKTKKTGGEFRMEVNKSKVISREGQKSNPYLERVPAAPACPCAGFMSSKIRERLRVERMEK